MQKYAVIQSQRSCLLIQQHPSVNIGLVCQHSVNIGPVCSPDYEFSDKTTNRAMVQRQHQGF